MSAPNVAPTRPGEGFKNWMLQTPSDSHLEGPYEKRDPHAGHSWWRVMCLTGVDYFSTLGYQPGIAALAAGVVSPIATLVLVAVTLFGALPMYKRVATESPHGDGSISMLERLLSWWHGKLFVLCLIGFVATGFIITITLSAADATAHIMENPYTQFTHGHQVAVTLLLIALLGAVFLKGLTEAIGIAVALVAVYLLFNVVVVGTGLLHILQNPGLLSDWTRLLFQAHGNPLAIIGAALVVFPRLALGLSGFETGVVVMPLVRGAPEDSPQSPRVRIQNTHKLLSAAAIIMSVMLVSSSLVTTVLIPPSEFLKDGSANGRALSYIAHGYLGSGVGTAYDISTILILWFAGASAMAGLLNIVPRYLPRYGMAPEWARATRPLVIIFTAVCAVITWGFQADVEAQAGAYATGVLALITSACIAVTLSAHRQQQTRSTIWFAIVSVVFVFTTAATMLERPEGVQIAALFILGIVITSIISRVYRATELRVSSVILDPVASRFIAEANQGDIRIIAHDTDIRDPEHYAQKEQEQRYYNHLPAGDPILFLEVTVVDPSEFAGDLRVYGEEVAGYRVLRAESSTVANAIAALLLHIRDITGNIPHAYFSWSETPPLAQVFRFLLFGEGDVPVVAHEVLRVRESNPDRRPVCHVA
ncbi:MAG: amino acid transporter [Chloroflexota bacterium]